MDVVMPPLLTSAAIKPDVEINDEGSGDEEDDDDGEVCPSVI